MTYSELIENITRLSSNPNIDFFTVGESTLGQPIYGLHIGTYEGKQILMESGTHAREYPAVLVVTGIAEYLADNVSQLSGGVYIIPLVNPDGVRLVLDGVEYISCEKLREYILLINDNSNDFSDWKANALAVDLNVNFPALWGEGSQNVFCPSPANFVGYYPASERETRLLIDFTGRVKPDLVLSYHTKGNVIYYGFETLTPDELSRDESIARIISGINGYTPIRTENSVGAYPDWFSDIYRLPAFTIEVGDASLPTPIPLSEVQPAIERNKDVPIVLLEGKPNV